MDGADDDKPRRRPVGRDEQVPLAPREPAIVAQALLPFDRDRGRAVRQVDPRDRALPIPRGIRQPDKIVV